MLQPQFIRGPLLPETHLLHPELHPVAHLLEDLPAEFHVLSGTQGLFSRELRALDGHRERARNLPKRACHVHVRQLGFRKADGS